MDNREYHVETKIGDWTVSMEAATDSATDLPYGAANTTFFVYVEDVDATYRRALAHGAISLTAPEDKPHLERSAEVQDMVGNTWRLYTFKKSASVRRSRV